MKKTSLNVLRVGMGITFLWIGILIFKDPDVWGGFINGWVLNLMPMSIHDAMTGTAVLDVAIGVCLIFDVFVWIAAFLGTLHMLLVLTVSGINDVTVRDIAILAGGFALFVDSVPESVKSRIPFLRKAI